MTDSSSWRHFTICIAIALTGVIIAILVVFLRGQSSVTNGGAGPVVPATCVPGSVFVNTTYGALYICTATDTWSTTWSKGGTPTMGACGITPSVSGTDWSGTITVGSGAVTSCTMNFSTTLAETPKCFVGSSAIITIGVTSSSTALVLTSTLSLAGDSIAYHCDP